MDAFRLLVTVLVTAGGVVAILLFEKRRAQGIEQDTRRAARDRPPGEADDREDRAE